MNAIASACNFSKGHFKGCVCCIKINMIYSGNTVASFTFKALSTLHCHHLLRLIYEVLTCRNVKTPSCTNLAFWGKWLQKISFFFNFLFPYPFSKKLGFLHSLLGERSCFIQVEFKINGGFSICPKGLAKLFSSFNLLKLAHFAIFFLLLIFRIIKLGFNKSHVSSLSPYS